jgi:hypothetical protein
MLLLPGFACSTVIAADERVEGYWLSYGKTEAVRARPEGGDPAHGFVAHNLPRDAPAVFTGVTVDVRSADAGGDDVDEHFTRAGCGLFTVRNYKLTEVF